jgi:flagellin-like hook-associated protein FlgL
MAVIPVNIARVSQNLRTFNMLQTVRTNHAQLFRVQNQLSTGLKFVAPSDDPIGAAAASQLDRKLDTLSAVEANVREANAVLLETECAMQDAIDLMIEANTIALEAAGDMISADERKSLAVVADSIIDQLIAIGNRHHLDTYLFSGHYGDDLPFEAIGSGVLFRGDQGRMQALVDTDLTQEWFTISGQEFFAAVSQAVSGFADLHPALTTHTRISDLNGANGSGVTLGRIVVSEGTEQVEIDLSGADTVGDILDKLNAELPSTLQASISASGINIDAVGPGPAEITISNFPGGRTAADLGIETDGIVGWITGRDLDPRLTERTALSDLNAGTGIDLSDGITIRSGSESVNIDFTDLETVEQVLNAINGTGLGVWAQIADDGKRLSVVNRVSGADLSIEENGGPAATNLGIRSMYGGTTLASLNDGLGVQTLEGDDFRIITADGTNIDIDLDQLDLSGSATVQDVLDLINTQGGPAVTAALASHGNGIVITDNTAGPGTIHVERLNLSPAIDGLGLDVPAGGATLVGRDVNPVKVNGAFTALVELRAAMNDNDTQAISAAGGRLETVLKQMQEAQGRAAAQARAMEGRSARIDSEVTATRILLSDVRDVDVAEAVVRFQQLQTALQANLVTASRVMNLSLLDYLE